MQYEKLYLKLGSDDEWSVLKNVTGLWTNVEWWDWEGTYRDLPKVTLATVTGGTTNTTVGGLAATGDNGATPALAADVPSRTRLVSADDALHIPPRAKLVRHTGIIIATHYASPWPVPAYTTPFTAALTDEITATAHAFLTGDVVRVHSAGVLPAGLDSTARYVVHRTGANTLLLRTLTTGELVDVTSAGTAPHTMTLLLRAQPAAHAQTFTAAVATDLLTAVAHPWQTGDVVSAHTTTTLPGGLTATALYTAVRVDADTLRLRDANTGAMVDITSVGTGTHTLALLSSAAPQANVYRYSSAQRPKVSMELPQ
jgi:hypothetical protein